MFNIVSYSLETSVHHTIIVYNLFFANFLQNLRFENIYLLLQK